MEKERIYELRIDEDDFLSGVDQISLVDEPAIEVNWVAFNKHKDVFHIPDNEDEKYLQMLMDKAELEEDLFMEGYVIDSVEILDGKDGFATNPNAESEWDEDEFKIRYKYMLNPRIGGQASVISTTRQFCRDLVNKNYVWRVEEMDNLTNEFGESALVWRGGYNCRHVWGKIKYKKDATIINKASINKGKADVGGFPSGLAPDLDVIGYEQPSTVTNKTLANPSPSTVKNLGLAKQFADECPEATQDIATNLKNRQRAIDEANYGPLNPNEPNEDYWKAKAKMFNGDVESAKKARCANCAFFVKTPSMLQCIADGINDVNELDTIHVANIGYCEAFDFKCAGARTCDAWVVGGPITEEDMGYDVSTIGGYKDPGIRRPKKKKRDSYKSYSDYPDSVKNNAKAVLKYVEENGWGSCGTDVGKQRANQLANGEPISEDTIKRMYSYLSRHEKDLESSKGYGDGCGKLMYDAWGGKTALSWAESKINAIEREKMSKQEFVTDDEKRIVVGPAMIPDLKIFRKDAKGNPYYVFFSAETIKMIAEKYMRNKYLDNNDEMHNGKPVKDVYVIESWIKESYEDKSNKFGYQHLPLNTWFVSMKVRNDETWEKIKSGDLKGFSVSGYFEEIAQFCMEEMFLKQVAEILKNVKD